MQRWFWFVQERGGRARRCVTLALLGFVVGAGGALVLELAARPRDPSVAARAEASALGQLIHDLADARTCSEALARLPRVTPPSRLRADPWGNPWSIRCYDDLAVVRSPGPDTELGTEDDIVEAAAAGSISTTRHADAGGERDG